MKKQLFFILVLSLVLANFVVAQEKTQEKIEIYFFYSKACPHCVKEQVFLDNLEEKYCELEIKKLVITEPENKILLKEKYEDYEVPEKMRGLVPVTFIHDRYILGYDTDETTGKQIEEYILQLMENPDLCSDENWQDKWPVTQIDLNRKIKIPLINREMDVSKLSPLGLAVVLGTLDGFNACAMIALGFLLAVLVSSKIRERIFLIGGTFILVSGIVYFLFIAAWFNLFVVLEQIQLISSLVGIIIILFALFLLKDYFYGIVCRLCEVRPGKQDIFVKIQKNLFQKMEKALKKDAPLALILLAIAGVAAGVNAVELICSFGFPLAFTKLLADLGVSPASYYSYLLVYILFYMLDDFLIFSFAVWTMKMTQVSQKYLKAIKLISGILLLALGLIMLLKPELLIFV